MIDPQRMLQKFMDYVRVDSESGNERAFAEVLLKDLGAFAGLSVEWAGGGEAAGSDAGNLYAYLPGTMQGEPILLCAHMDTVVPGRGIDPYVEDGFVKSRDGTILGGDDKAGITAILEALRAVLEEGLPHRPVELLFTVKEEVGLMGAKTFDISRVKSRLALSVDYVGSPGVMPIRGPGMMEIRAKIHGVPAHAGIAPEAGVSAIMVGAAAVSRMKLLRVDEETTANIGTFRAVGPTNIVSPEAEIVIEVRSRSKVKLAGHTNELVQALQSAADEYGARLECTVREGYVPYDIPGDDPQVVRVAEACRRAGVTPEFVSCGGGSDSNVFNAQGLVSFNIGSGMKDVHTTDESLSIAEFVSAARVLRELIL
ncbi:M20/M25/M40 family metallo-hydrolase [Gehongia tenuis]|uniref:M20/M25/M40 family metallo-hydrolase n=1 Tax=Gehongia tenuis TaxID=2763655 RepID=A0A926HP07_9FIRM|nr:M20/M25/M40 family metallo-hydrolase [Gehongia tenuis]MBC8530718.1 M20/M25/M40 family metallo-hydrolase [Gehongia tenuis]